MLMAYNEKLYPPLNAEQLASCSIVFRELRRSKTLDSADIVSPGLGVEQFLVYLNQQGFLFHGSPVDLPHGRQLLPMNWRVRRLAGPRLYVTQLPPIAILHALISPGRRVHLYYPGKIPPISAFELHLYAPGEWPSSPNLAYTINDPGNVYVLPCTEKLCPSPARNPWEGIYTCAQDFLYKISVHLQDFACPIKEFHSDEDVRGNIYSLVNTP